MRNNQIDKISMESSKLPLARFNLSHDVSTTFSFGELQPVFVREMLPNSKLSLQTEQLVRNAPMVAPTFGRLRKKDFSQFVPLEDIMPCYNEFLSSTRYTYGTSTYIPQNKVNTKLGNLLLFQLLGASLTIYERKSNLGGIDAWVAPDVTEWTSTVEPFLTNAYGSGWHNASDSFSSGPFAKVGQYTTHSISTSVLVDPDWLWTYSNDWSLPLANKDFYYKSGDYVDISSADVVLERDVTYNGETKRFAFAFLLSGFGKRIRKALIGSNYPISWDDGNKTVCLLPLMATYKAYWDLFAIEQFVNFQDTSLSRLISWWLTAPNTINFVESINSIGYFQSLMFDLGCMWFTSSQDWTSAHQANIVNASHGYNVNGFIDVSSSGHQVDSAGNVVSIGHKTVESDFGYDSHAVINRLVHSQLDSELLKKLYKWANRNSVIGQRVAELLRAQGFADYVDKCKSNFIGFSDSPLPISDVVNSADTFDAAAGVGKQLGEFGGKGVNYSNNKPHRFAADKAGFWVTLSVVVPDCGYAQLADPSIYGVTKEDCYNPEFDAVGYEASTKAQTVCSQVDWTKPVSDGYATSAQPFGYIPRFSKFKIKNNLMNGDFNLRSCRESYLPFTLDKFMDVNGEKKRSETSISTGYQINCTKSDLSFKDIMTAGPAWRFLTRYPWLCNFNRIFSYVGDTLNKFNLAYDGGNSALFELSAPVYDNFMVHTVNNVQYYARMLPIEDSYETREDGNKGRADMSVDKA